MFGKNTLQLSFLKTTFQYLDNGLVNKKVKDDFAYLILSKKINGVYY